MLKGLFFGAIRHSWYSGAQRLGAMRSVVPTIEGIDTEDRSSERSLSRRLRRRFAREAHSPAEIQNYNELILAYCAGPAPDFVWFEWPLKMRAETLRKIRERWPCTSTICFQDDNPFGDRTFDRFAWRDFIENIPLYDWHFVKRESDVREFSRRGANRVLLFTHGVYEPLFHPDTRPPSERSPVWPVCFVGTAIDHRVDYVTKLFERYHIHVKVFGDRWKRTWVGWRHARYFSPAAYSEAYVKEIANSKISLAFVSSSNRDEYTMRTFEIPGSGGFFLAERTPKHQELYDEGKEAEFFSSVEECADKINFYLTHESARQRIAAAGYERCIRSGYLLVSRIREALGTLFPDQV